MKPTKTKKKPVKKGKRDRELDLARQQELFPESFFERQVKQTEFPFAAETRTRPIQPSLFGDFF